MFMLFWVVIPAQAQYKILEDKGALDQVHQAIDSIYNLNFDAADPIIAKLEKKLPDYPGLVLLKAFYTNWKYQPIKKGRAAYGRFEAYLQKGIEQSEAMLDKDANNVEATFFLMACHAYLAQLYVNNGQNMKALGEAKYAYKYIKEGFDYTDVNPEFYFSSGIYNYYRERYPEENPFYKSFLWFFRSGDMTEGIRMLQRGSHEAVFTQAECLTYLFHIFLRYENEPEDAMYYARILKNKYPDNLHFTANYIENMMRLNSIGDALPDILLLIDSDKEYDQYLGNIYYGIYLLDHEKKPQKSMEYLKRADQLGDRDGTHDAHHDSMLYLGMGKGFKEMGKRELAMENIKKSIKSAEYSAYRMDAEALLSTF